jgi:hypothetical protein
MKRGLLSMTYVGYFTENPSAFVPRFLLLRKKPKKEALMLQKD